MKNFFNSIIFGLSAAVTQQLLRYFFDDVYSFSFVEFGLFFLVSTSIGFLVSDRLIKQPEHK